MSDSGAPRQLSPEERSALLAYLADRLGTGEVLVTRDQFQSAAAEGYRILTGQEPDTALQAGLSEMLSQVHREDPAALLVPGVENWIALSILADVRRRGWGITEVHERGTQPIREFLRGAKARALLEELGLNPQQINMGACQRFVANRVAGRRDDSHKQAAARLARLQTAAAARPDSGATVEARIDALLEGPRDLPDEAEAAARKSSEKASAQALRREQMAELVSHLDNYVALGRIDAEDAERLRKVHQVDQAMRGGRVERDKGSKIRNSILAGTARDRIERTVREAVDTAVAYLQVFNALRRIEAGFDPALRFLARHGDVINEDAGEQAPAGLGQVVEALAADPDTLRPLIDMMDRKEAEVRMIAAHLPPYSHILRRDQGRVERVLVDEAFVEASLRGGTPEALSEQLHGADRRGRARVAAALLSFTVLIGRVIKPTPFRKELRLLKVNLIIEEFYRSTDDVGQARQRALDFLQGRLRSLYPDLSREETEALQERGNEIVDRVEARVLAERAAAGTAPEADADPEPEEELTEDEERQGVQIHRVEVRGTAGRMRLIRYKVMPDPDEEERFIIVQRDPESGELVPSLRRGAKRYVERGRDGAWQLARD